MSCYKAIIVCSLAFFLLLVFTIVQQIRSFIRTTDNPVSSINFYSNTNGFHESSVIIFTGFIMQAVANDSINLAVTPFLVSEHCQCLNGSVETMMRYYECDNILRLNSSIEDGTDAILMETPVNWGASQREVLICDHPRDPVVGFTFVILMQPFEQIKNTWIKMSKPERLQLVNSSFLNEVQVWVHCNFYSSLQLRKTELYVQHKLNSSTIDVLSGSTENVIRGQTRINFAWLDGNVTIVDKFSEYSVWSLAMLLCAVLLGLERCYTVVNRARLQHRKHLKKLNRKHSMAGLETNSLNQADEV
ncbi:uncharacterized protein LOC134855496 [Symsagittifera roscoffensis]|uniref:uncharacterized protein LOC134855496 n=1 Tax=Symsagittifera roscoffensis TaxID=84072 RepID=UPI00307CA951